MGSIIRAVAAESNIKIAVEYHCYCDRDRVAGALKSIGTDAINEMAASGEPTEVECRFCNAKYSFTAE